MIIVLDQEGDPGLDLLNVWITQRQSADFFRLVLARHPYILFPRNRLQQAPYAYHFKFRSRQNQYTFGAVVPSASWIV